MAAKFARDIANQLALVLGDRHGSWIFVDGTKEAERAGVGEPWRPAGLPDKDESRFDLLVSVPTEEDPDEVVYEIVVRRK